MRLTADRTEPENESFAWLRNAYRAVSFPGTSAKPAEVLRRKLSSTNSLEAQPQLEAIARIL